MRLVGWTAQGRVTELVLEHGMHPDVALYRAGWVAERPLRSECAGGEVVVEFTVRAVTPADTPPPVRRVVHEEPGAGEIPFVHQRVGAYGDVLSDRGLLGTVLSKLTGAPGIWALPGGGLEAGEAPEAGLLREVYEETGQEIVPGRLLSLQSDHWIGRAPGGRLEDYHALRIIYAAQCETPSRPRVLDRGGSTARAGWVSIGDWQRLPWTRTARQVLNQHLPSRLSPGSRQPDEGQSLK